LYGNWFKGKLSKISKKIWILPNFRRKWQQVHGTSNLWSSKNPSLVIDLTREFHSGFLKSKIYYNRMRVLPLTSHRLTNHVGVAVGRGVVGVALGSISSSFYKQLLRLKFYTDLTGSWSRAKS
jgi:hypothetical protein